MKVVCNIRVGSLYVSDVAVLVVIRQSKVLCSGGVREAHGSRQPHALPNAHASLTTHKEGPGCWRGPMMRS